MAQVGGLEDGNLASVVPVRPPFQSFSTATCLNFASARAESGLFLRCAQAKASAELAQRVSADPSVESQSAEPANAVTADVAADKERISTSGEWPHDKCLDLQIELRA